VTRIAKIRLVAENKIEACKVGAVITIVGNKKKMFLKNINYHY